MISGGMFLQIQTDIYIYIVYIYIYNVILYIYNITVKCGRSEINTTKEMSENVVQPGIEPGSPDYRSDALTTFIYIYKRKIQ